MTNLEQWFSEQEEKISQVSRQINDTFDLEEEGQRKALKEIKKTFSSHWNYAVNRLDSESREHVLALVRGKHSKRRREA